ncbi:MAG: peptide chain release factor 2 [Betaproteobacteria bacterium]|nr:MAG: peptide chain release factor 2 [Betaproteobacteria bacterium]TAG48962.1 MAG: peptide chain release factor 2 [Betaproteobacteria bacterium]
MQPSPCKNLSANSKTPSPRRKASSPNFGGYFDYDRKARRLEELNAALEDPKAWDDPNKAREIGKEKRAIDFVIENINRLTTDITGCADLFEMAVEESDEATLQSVKADIDRSNATLAEMEFKRMLSGEADDSNCFLDINAGSGGTEAQDWAQMLFRMYCRYGERKGFKVEIEDHTDGDVAGIKGASIKISGDYAYGFLRTETGVHRLVRKSPFDSNAKRHTSFASVFVYPEVDDSIQIDINPSDVRTDTFRASGAGGQHINKTDSAVRLTHIPTGIVVQCQDGRSQHSNRDVAWKRLRSRLYDFELRKRQEAQQKLEDTKTDIGWGHQIRSYVLDQSRIKDLRTNHETGNTGAVLDGDLDPFIEASLKAGAALGTGEAA